MASSIIWTSLTVAAIAISWLMIVLWREICSQNGSTPRIEAEIWWKTTPWLRVLVGAIVGILIMAIVCFVCGVPLQPYVWIWLPGWAATVYGQTHHRRENTELTSAASQAPPRVSSPTPPATPPSQAQACEEELVRLLHGDRAMARRLIRGAGSADRAIAQLLRDRR